METVNCSNTTTAIEHLSQNKQQMEIRPICNHKGSAVWLRKQYIITFWLETSLLLLIDVNFTQLLLFAGNVCLWVLVYFANYEFLSLTFKTPYEKSFVKLSR